MKELKQNNHINRNHLSFEESLIKSIHLYYNTMDIRRLSLKKLDRNSHDCVFSTSPRRSSSFTFSPRKTPSPRSCNNNGTSFELRSQRNSPRGTTSLVIKKIKEIEKGGSGSIIYKGKIDGGCYCVKELVLRNKNTKELKQFQDEIELLRSLPKNSHIVEYIGYQQTPQKIQIIMSLYDGSLYEYIKRLKRKKRTFTINQIAVVCQQLLKGISVLHNRKLIHRDLKSANVLYDGDVKIFKSLYFVIADLGESKIIRQNDKAKTMKGTPAWIAPEVYDKGVSHYSFSADIWSFGMIIYEMMTLKFPFYGEKFASNAIIAGGKPILTKNQIYAYAPILPLWEYCTTRDPSKRITPSRALRMLSVILEPE